MRSSTGEYALCAQLVSVHTRMLAVPARIRGHLTCVRGVQGCEDRGHLRGYQQHSAADHSEAAVTGLQAEVNLAQCTIAT